MWNPKANSIFLQAVELDSPEQRRAYLDQACDGDAALRERVESLLSASKPENDFLESPAVAVDVALQSPAVELIGTQIGPYKLVEQIGEGGMGVVYMAEQKEPVRRKVALKVIKPGMDTRQVLGRFEAERQTLALMDHPGIAKVHDAGTSESGRPYFVMELVRGLSIADYCEKKKPTTRERLELFTKVCRAVQHAHQKGIIHRDLKPSNVLVTIMEDGPLPKVIDFGVAKAINQRLAEQTQFTNFAQMVGTPLYMSPEQTEMTGFDIDTRSDVYSLGVLLYELLTGVTPFDKETLKKVGYDEIRRIIREDEPPRPSFRISTLKAEQLSTVSGQAGIDTRKYSRSLEGELDWIVMRALEKDRNRRYESASAMVDDIQRYLNDEPVEACPPSASYRLRKFARRNKVLIGTASLVVAALVLGIIGTAWQANLAWDAQELAQTRLGNEREERTRAERAEATALNEAAISVAVNAFLNDDLLSQASPENQPNPNVTLHAVIDQAAEKIQERFAEQPVIKAAILHTLAKTYRSIGQLDKAKQHAERALQLRSEHLGADDAKTIETQSLLGLILAKQGDYQGSRQLLDDLLVRARRTLGSEHALTITVMSYLARTMLSQGDYTQSERLFHQILDIRKRTVGQDDPKTLRSMSNLSKVYFLQDRTDKAEKFCRQTLEIQRRILGDDHPHTLSSQIALAEISISQHHYEEGESLLLQSLESFRRTHGKEHPSTLMCEGVRANFLHHQGRLDESVALYRQSLEILRRTQGAVRWPGFRGHANT